MLRVCVLLKIDDAVVLSSHPLVTSAQAEARVWLGGRRAGAANLVHTAVPLHPRIPGGATEARQAARLTPCLPGLLGGEVLLLILGMDPKATRRGFRDLVLGGWGDCSLSSMGTLSPLSSLLELVLRALEG